MSTKSRALPALKLCQQMYAELSTQNKQYLASRYTVTLIRYADPVEADHA